MIHDDAEGSMLVELVERLGHTVDWWLDQPLAFLRWAYGHLQELDRRKRWEAQLKDVDSAWFMARAYHEPNTLKDEQVRLLNSAAGKETDELALVKAQRMLAEFERGKTLEGMTYGHQGRCEQS